MDRNIGLIKYSSIENNPLTMFSRHLKIQIFQIFMNFLPQAHPGP